MDYIFRLSRIAEYASRLGRNGQKRVDIVSREEVLNNSFENFLAVFFWPNFRFPETDL
jgi:hypothetical protein